MVGVGGTCCAVWAVSAARALSIVVCCRGGRLRRCFGGRGFGAFGGGDAVACVGGTPGAVEEDGAAVSLGVGLTRSAGVRMR